MCLPSSYREISSAHEDHLQARMYEISDVSYAQFVNQQLTWILAVGVSMVPVGSGRVGNKLICVRITGLYWTVRHTTCSVGGYSALLKHAMKM